MKALRALIFLGENRERSDTVGKAFSVEKDNRKAPFYGVAFETKYGDPA
jgi:hypothetical protein